MMDCPKLAGFFVIFCLAATINPPLAKSQNSLCSKPEGNTNIRFTVLNSTNQAVVIHRVDTRCVESRFGTVIKPNQTFIDNKNKAGYVFRVKNAKTGQVLKEIVIKPNSTKFVIDQVNPAITAIKPPEKVAVSNATSQTCNDPRNPLKKEEIDNILRVHNQARAEVGVPPLVWNCQLAAEAQAWVDKGVLEHSSTSYGENLASSAPSSRQISIKGPQLWLTEKKFWNNKTATCQPGEVCGHYTQMVWRKTTEVGCGLNFKASLYPGFDRNSDYLTCLYNPAGNYPGPAY